MRRSSVVVAVVVLGCGGQEQGSGPPPLTEPAVLTDVNPDPNIVEVSLVAGLATAEYLRGKPTEVWAYRDGALPGSKGTIPGPMLRAKVGDQVIVHFKN